MIILLIILFVLFLYLLNKIIDILVFPICYSLNGDRPIDTVSFDTYVPFKTVIGNGINNETGKI